MKLKTCNIPDRLMAALVAVGMIALIGLGGGAARAADISSKELAEGLFLFQGAGSNVVAMADGGDLLVVDGGLKENSRDLYSAIRKATGGKQIKTLIDTHWHPEQVGLNERAGRDGAAIIAHEQTYIYLSHRVTSPLFEGSFGPLDERALPTQHGRDGGEFTFAGHKVVYGYLPAAHTNGDLYVFFPDLNVLVAGGVVGSNSWPLIDYWNGAFIGGLVQAHEKLVSMVTDDTIVVPAQGPTITGARLKTDRDMYAQLFKDLQYLMNKGMGYNDAVALNPLKPHEAEFGDASAFINGAYRSEEMTNVPD